LGNDDPVLAKQLTCQSSKDAAAWLRPGNRLLPGFAS